MRIDRDVSLRYMYAAKIIVVQFYRVVIARTFDSFDTYMYMHSHVAVILHGRDVVEGACLQLE